jgi:hypothetical protein
VVHYDNSIFVAAFAFVFGNQLLSASVVSFPQQIIELFQHSTRIALYNS